MAPPPLGPPKSSLVCWAVELPFLKVMFCTIRRGWLKQSEVAVPSAWSHVFMYRIRRAPPPLSATIPPPSRTTRRLVLRTSAVASIVIVTGRGPQLKVITPPAATAATTACEVQPAGVPSPMTWSGWLVLTGRPAAGTNAWPAGFPAAGSRTGVGEGLGLCPRRPCRAPAASAATGTGARRSPTPGGPAGPADGTGARCRRPGQRNSFSM
jgi:hypothetical protein